VVVYLSQFTYKQYHLTDRPEPTQVPHPYSCTATKQHNCSLSATQCLSSTPAY